MILVLVRLVNNIAMLFLTHADSRENAYSLTSRRLDPLVALYKSISSDMHHATFRVVGI
jgi:hypothetical protein